MNGRCLLRRGEGCPKGGGTRSPAFGCRAAIFVVTAGVVLLAVVLTVTLLNAGTGVASAANETTVSGDPALDVQAPDNSFDAGDDATLDLFVPNEGEVDEDGETHPQEARERVTEARSTQVEITSTGDAPVRVDTGQQSLGTIEAGDTAGPASFDIFVDSDAQPGEYDLEVTLEFTNVTEVTYERDDDGNLLYREETTDVTATYEVPIVVNDEARFEIHSTYDGTQIDEMGNLTVQMENTGTEDVSNAVVTAQSSDQDVYFGSGGQSSETSVGEWAAGENKTLTYRTGTNPEAISKFYPVDFSISYETPEGDDQTQTVSRSIRPLPRQRYRVSNVTHDVTIGDSGVLELDVANLGPRNVTHTSVSVSADDPAITFETGDGGAPTTTSFVGDWSAGDEKTLRLRTGIDDDAIQRNYTVEVTVQARDSDDNTLNERTRQFALDPLPRQRYRIENATHDVPIGDNGVLVLDVTNEGPEPVTQASVEITANDQAIVFGDGAASEPVQFEDVALETPDGGAPGSEAFVGEWAVGETKTVRYQAGATEEALQRNYTVDVAVQAEDTNGTDLATRTRQFGFRPLAEQQFAIAGVADSLRVGEDGDLVGTVTNLGDQPVRNVVVICDSDHSNVFPRETEYAVGTLDPGETREFSFRIGLSAEAEPTPRVFEFQTRYRNHEDEVRIDDAQDLVVDVGPERDAFAFEPVEATFVPGDTDVVELSVENTKNETLSDVQIQLFADSPIEGEDDEVYVSSLAPGETETVVFEVSVGGGALAKNYSVSLDVRYEDERGEKQLSGTYRVPITVVESEESEFPLLPVAGGSIAVVVVVAFLLRRRIAGATAVLAERAGG